MDEVVPDRSLKRLRLDPKSLAEIIEILRRNDRRAIVKLDDVKVDDPTHADAAQLASAKSVDIVSYWVNPDRPTWGRRHFVYLASGPGGAQYFGDSMSPEVTTVLKDLDDYFGRRNEPAAPDARPADRMPTAPAMNDPKVFLIATAVVLLVAVLSFIAGRLTAQPEPMVIERLAVPTAPADENRPAPTDTNSPATTTADSPG